ncbi:MAG TPA: hypothetical protein DCM40_23460, partial [Maribacter sp.]|nr:hypothetical protein [Maribacter sp.]
LDCDYEFLSSLTYNQARIQKPICITTNKAFTHGQRQRLNFFKKIDNLIEIDFYGKNNISSLFRTYKGPPERSPEHPRDKFILRDYNVSFSIENGKRRNFFTRTQESMLCWTMPIYWGCPNLEDFFPEFSYRYVNIEEKITPEYLAHLTRPVEKNELLALEESRNLILRKYNFFPFIDNILKDL